MKFYSNIKLHIYSVRFMRWSALRPKFGRVSIFDSVKIKSSLSLYNARRLVVAGAQPGFC